MKKHIKYLTISLFITLMVGSCDVEEEPVSYAGDSLFDNEAGTQSVLNGVYAGVAGYNYYASGFHQFLNVGSGLYASEKRGYYDNIAGLNAVPSTKDVGDVWRGLYQAIGRANDLIYNLEAYQWEDTTTYNDIMGQAYFLRSLTYFNLVRIYGGVPIVTEPVTPDKINNPRESTDDVFTQIIIDAETAAGLLPAIGSGTKGRPDKSAVYMLLAKAYIHMAGNRTSAETEYWQNAYNEAIKAYGSRSLVPDFRTLWYEETGQNTAESLFELQSNEEVTMRLHQLSTPKNGSVGLNTWGRFKPNLEVYDKHANAYPTDPRIPSTFITEYTYYKSATNTKIQLT